MLREFFNLAITIIVLWVIASVIISEGDDMPHNMKVDVTNNILTIEIDLDGAAIKDTKAGRSQIIASSDGNEPVAEGIAVNLNVYKKKQQ